MASGPGGAKAVRVVTNLKEGPMSDALTSESMSPGLVRVAERARQEPQAKFHSLAHLIDVEALRRAFHRQRPEAAPGVDGVTSPFSVSTFPKTIEARRVPSASRASRTKLSRMH